MCPELDSKTYDLGQTTLSLLECLLSHPPDGDNIYFANFSKNQKQSMEIT